MKVQVLRIDAFKTSDGHIFEKEGDADQHERMYGLGKFCEANGVVDKQRDQLIKGEPLFEWLVLNRRMLIKFLRNTEDK